MNSAEWSQLRRLLHGRRDAIADSWYRAMATTCYVPLKAAEVHLHLAGLTEQAIALLLTEPFEHHRAEAIGASLARLHYLQPEALGRTQEILTQQLAEGLPADQVIALQPRLTALLGGLAAGFFQQAVETILAEQEQTRSALVTELRRVEEALRKAHDEVEIRVKKRTAELAKANEALRAEIAERKRMEEVLQAAIQEWRTTFNAINDAICLLDMKGRVQRCNKAMMDLLGKPFNEIIDHTCCELVHGTSEPIRGCPYVRMRETHRRETLVLPKGDRWFDVATDPLLDEESRLVGAVHIMTDITERVQAEEMVREHGRDLQRLSVQLINAQEAERERISRELHDEMGQALTAMRINLATIEKGLPPGCSPAIRERLAETRSQAQQILEQIRKLSHDLRPSMLDDLGLVPALRWYVNQYTQRLNIEVEFEAIDFQERLTMEVETVLYRVVQEALTNVAKHAQAHKVWIRLERKDTTVAASIEDDGQGFDIQKVAGRAAPERGTGLIGMRERVTSLGGRFRIQSRPGQGTRLTIEIPVHLR